MKILQIDETLDLCEQHITDANVSGTKIESMLTRAVLVYTCSVFEEKIEQMISKRADSLNDPAMCDFIKSCVSAVFRSMKSSELAGLMNRFGLEFKQSFLNRTLANDRAVAFYNNIIVSRHGVAHEESINMTLRELRQSYEEGHIVLDFLEETINETYPT